MLRTESEPQIVKRVDIPKNSWECDAAESLQQEIEAIKKQGRPSEETVVTNDSSLPKHNTRKEVAKEAGVSDGNRRHHPI